MVITASEKLTQYRLRNTHDDKRDLLFHGTLLASMAVSTTHGRLFSRLYQSEPQLLVGERHLQSNRATAKDTHEAQSFNVGGERDVDEGCVAQMTAFFGPNISFSLLREAGFSQFEYIGTGQLAGVYHDPIIEEAC